MASLGLDQPPEEFVANLPAPIKRRVEVLQKLQEKKDELETQFRKERAELEAKYEALYGERGSGAAEAGGGEAQVGCAVPAQCDGG